MQTLSLVGDRHLIAAPSGPTGSPNFAHVFGQVFGYVHIMEMYNGFALGFCANCDGRATADKLYS